MKDLPTGTSRVALVTDVPLPEAGSAPNIDEVHALGPAAQGHGPAFRRASRRADRAQRLLLHLQQDPWVIAQVSAGATLVALDAPAGIAVGHIAEYGLTTGRFDAVAHRLPVALIHLLVRIRGVPEGRRHQLAHVAIVRLHRLHRPEAADRVMRSALRHLTTPRLRADLLGDVVSHDLARGHASEVAAEAYAAELAVADQHHAAGQHGRAAAAFDEAARTAFHRVLHFDHQVSPLAADPEAYTAPLASSTTAKALRAPRGRTLLPSAGTGTTRLLIATWRNADFLGEIRSHLDHHRDFETQFVDFHKDAALRPLVGKVVQQTLSGGSSVRSAAEEIFRPYLDAADVVFADWCTELAVLITQVDPRDTRLVVRMHSYEAFTRWPHLIDVSRIDDLVFVSEHLRTLAVAAMPALRQPGAPRLHVLINAVDLQRCVRPKQADARFTLALLGASKTVKDPRWAIDVLRRLREHDERYRLLLIGGKFQNPSPATQDYTDALDRDLAELEPSGAIRRISFTDDVPAALEEVGVVVSSSVRESFHIGLAEGAASGAVPVVRDWPFFPGAAHDLFPHDWVVEDPAAAATRILALTADETTWRDAGSEASRWVVSRYDWRHVSQGYETLLGHYDRMGKNR